MRMGRYITVAIFALAVAASCREAEKTPPSSDAGTAKATKAYPPAAEIDDPIRCATDDECPKVLACGPCKPNEAIPSRFLRINCAVNPCPGRQAYCASNGVCAVKP